jgi:hypothetical protein
MVTERRDFDKYFLYKKIEILLVLRFNYLEIYAQQNAEQLGICNRRRFQLQLQPKN